MIRVISPECNACRQVLSALLYWSRLCCAQAERKAKEMAADAATARQEKATTEMYMAEQADMYENHIAHMTTETHWVSSRSPACTCMR